MTLSLPFRPHGLLLLLALNLANPSGAIAQESFSDSSRLNNLSYVRAAIKEIDDQQLWDSMNLDRPGLEEIRKSARRADFPQAAAAWARYWSAKQQPSYITSMDHLFLDTDLLTPLDDLRRSLLSSPDERDLIMTRAEQILQNRIKAWGDSIMDFGQRVDFNRDIGQSGKYGFHYWIWSRPLLMAWAATRDDKYLAKLDQLFQWWYEQRNSIVRNIPKFDVVYYELGLGFRNRIFLEYYLLPFKHRSPASHIEMLKTFLAAGRWLCELETWEGYRAGNWQIHGAYMLVQLGLALPEFRESARWKQIGLQRMLEHLDLDFFKDGGHSERSPRNYTMSTYLTYRNLAYLLSAYRVEPDAARRVRASMGRTVEWWRSILTPTGELPAINDSHRGLFPDRLMRDGEEMFGNQQNSRPRTSSRHMPESGFTVMRSDSTREALYLLLNYGPFAGFHTHYDLLDFELYAYGKPLAVDAGIGSTYDDPLYPDWYRSSKAHNMVVVNDSSIEREGMQGENIRWGSTHSVDYFSGDESGYRRFGVQHRRQVAFVKPLYWFVLDDLHCSRSGDTLSWYFHSPTPLVRDTIDFVSATTPGIEIAPAGISNTTRSGSGMAASTTNMTPGKTEIIGWIRFDQVSQSDSMHQFPVLLFPYRKERHKPVVARLSSRHFVVEHEGSTDHLYFSGGDYHDGEIQTDASFVLIRGSKKSRLSYVVINGTYLQFQTKTLWSSHTTSSGEGRIQ